MGIEPSIDITAGQRKNILALLERHLPDVEAWVYGSRVKWTSRPQSDLDMVVFAAPGQKRAVGDLREAFEESNLPFRVDLFVWDDVPDLFRKQIRQDHMVLAKPPVLAKHWPRMRLGECVVMNEATYSPKEEWPFVNYLDTGSITDNRIEGIQCLKLNKDKLPDRARRKIEPGDIVFSTVRPNQRHFGLLRDVPENFLASTGFAVFRAREDVADTGFIYWFLAQERIINQLHTIAEHSTTAYPSIRPADIKNLDIDLPPLPEQRAIAHVLGALDDKIELNRRMNRTLEAMAQAIFKDWFVDFGPVRAKTEGREPYLPPEIWKLFPNRFVNSELGEIPEGWGAGHMEEGFEIVMGQSPPGHTYNDTGDGLPFFQGRSDFGFRYPKNRKFCTAPNRIAQPWDTLVSVRAPVGDINMAWEQCCIGRGVAALRLRSGAVSYGYCAVQGLQAHMREYEHTGTVFGAINRKQLAQLPLLQPAPEVIRGFEAFIHPKDQMIRLRTAEIATLSTFRDTLLPKLISGQIRLRDSERLVGEIA